MLCPEARGVIGVRAVTCRYRGLRLSACASQSRPTPLTYARRRHAGHLQHKNRRRRHCMRAQAFARALTGFNYNDPTARIVGDHDFAASVSDGDVND